jgi:hypothetical protein
VEGERETKAEAIARLLNDPGRLARAAIREAENELRRARLRKELVPLLDELRALGLNLGGILGFDIRPSDLAIALPVLLQHLTKPYSSDALMSIAHRFETREARPYWDSIISLYESTTDDPEAQKETWRDRLAVAIDTMATKSDFETLERLIRNPGLGNGRIMLIPSVIRLGRDRGWAVLKALENDPALHKEIAYRFSGKARREKAKKRRTL